MVQVKNPCFSFAAQGKLGPIHFSHHGGKDYVYQPGTGAAVRPTAKQVQQRADFTEGAHQWNNLTAGERWWWNQIAARLWRPATKDCKKPRLNGYQTWIMFWRGTEIGPNKLIEIFLLMAMMALLFGIPIP